MLLPPSTGPGPSQFSSLALAPWGVVCVASSTSLELGVLGEREVGQGHYTQWILEDNSRAELPLAGAEERFPRGLALATTSCR